MNKNIKAKTKKLDLTEKTVMVAVDFSRIGNSRRLPTNQYSVDANPKMIRASKKLLDSAELRKINRFDGSVRDYIASLALPSMFKSGFWIVPNELVEELDAALVEFAEQRKPLVEIFVKAYPELMEKAEALLRGTFNEADYLSEEAVRAEFKFHWRYVSFGVPAELEAIKAEVFEREQEKAETHWQEATTGIIQLLRASLGEMVDHMVERLEPGSDGKPKVFKASSIENINAFIKTFSARNVADDKELEALVEKAKGLTSGLEPDSLRKDEELKAKFTIGMANIKAQLDTMITNKPVRKIKFDGEEGAAPAAAAA